jgi:hypothetical protein
MTIDPVLLRGDSQVIPGLGDGSATNSDPLAQSPKQTGKRHAGFADEDATSKRSKPNQARGQRVLLNAQNQPMPSKRVNAIVKAEKGNAIADFAAAEAMMMVSDQAEVEGGSKAPENLCDGVQNRVRPLFTCYGEQSLTSISFVPVAWTWEEW